MKSKSVLKTNKTSNQNPPTWFLDQGVRKLGNVAHFLLLNSDGKRPQFVELHTFGK